MGKIIKSKKRQIAIGGFTIYDLLIIATILLQGSNHLIVFPSPVFKYTIAALFVALTIKSVKEKKSIKVNVATAICLVLSYIYSIIVSADQRIVIPMVFFVLELLAFKMYIDLFKTKKELFEKILKIIYCSSVIITVIGSIQIVGYKMNIEPLYDYKWLGILPNHYSYLTEGRFYSIYDEPAHLCTILGSGLFACYYFYRKSKRGKYLAMLALMAVFGFMTGSVITYISMALFVIFIILFTYYFAKKRIPKTALTFAIIPILIISTLALLNPTLVTDSVGKVHNFFSNNADNAYLQNRTTFAIKSNYLIATKKIDDGYIFGTGIFTHEFYYYKYINQVYDSHYQQYLNFSDAASVFIRLISEFGVLSIIIFSLIVVLLVKLFVARDYMGVFYILLFITQGMRLGDYTWLFNCLPIVIIASLYNKKAFLKDGGANETSIHNNVSKRG